MHEKLGQNTQAIQYHSRAHETNQHIYGVTHPASINSLESVGKNCELAGDYRGALNARRGVFQHYAKTLGKTDKRVVEMEASLGTLTALAVKSAKELRMKLKAGVELVE